MTTGESIALCWKWRHLAHAFFRAELALRLLEGDIRARTGG